MTVKELLRVTSTSRKIQIFDEFNDLVYEQSKDKNIGRFTFFDNEVIWIYKIDSEEIVLKVGYK